MTPRSFRVRVVVAGLVLLGLRGTSSLLIRPPPPPHLLQHLHHHPPPPRSAIAGWCPPDFQRNPLVVISLDGFRADYLGLKETPTIEALSRRGVSTPFIKPSYPSITFPNHYTIVTGLLPPYHGIIANKFFDPAFNATFRVGRKEFFQKRFWGGEPIWRTAEKQGRIAAAYFWPGSETKGRRPTYWRTYNESHPFATRVDTVLSWLDLPRARRPDLITFYFQEPDRQGHEHGPHSSQVREALQKVDNTLRRFLKGLQARNLLNCVNVIVLADHGMAPAGKERVILMQDFIPDIDKKTRFWNGVFPRFERTDKSPENTQKMLEELSCRRREMRVYHKKHLPLRWHLGSQRRVEEVVLDLDSGYQVDFDGTYEPDEGDHGYDNIFHVMNALFLAHGPSFKSGVEVESFQNVELYNLMCALLGVSPAPNNGTWGALHHLLLSPPPVHDTTTHLIPPIARVDALPDDGSEESEETEDECGALLRSLVHAENNGLVLFQRHLPWGVPQYSMNSVKILLHHDHITGYSESLKTPLWTAFHLDGAPGGSKEARWRRDPRLPRGSQVDLEEEEDASWEPLFHNVFSSDRTLRAVPFLSSNAVPIEDQLHPRLEAFRRMLLKWASIFEGGVNVVMGTVFDWDSDSLADDVMRFPGQPVMGPTHLFAVVTRCLGGRGADCPGDWLDSNAFIFPQRLPVSNCMEFESFAREFSAKIDDVEKATGLQFFPLLRFADRTRLKIRIHSNLWGMEKWQNRIRSDAFGLKKR